MKNMILKYFRKQATLLFSLFVLPAVFILIGNTNLVFLAYISLTFAYIFMLDDFSYSLALPISRKDIVIANYLAYLILGVIIVFYMAGLLFTASKFFNLATDQSLSLLGILYTFNILAIFSIIIPLSIISKYNHFVSRIAFLPGVLGYLLMLPILNYFEYLAKINILYHLIFTLLLTSSLAYCGIKISLKKIESIDF
jgi:hypothetical protein